MMVEITPSTDVDQITCIAGRLIVNLISMAGARGIGAFVIMDGCD